jgi:FkbM family methyltransferase
MTAIKKTNTDTFRKGEIKENVIVCTPDDNRLMTPYVIAEQGDWFENEIDFVRCLVTPGTQMIDIGANYGVYTLAAAKRMAGEGTIWAFEPCAETVRYLNESVTLNEFKNVKVEAKGLGRIEGWANLSTHSNSELNSVSDDGAANGERIAITTLDVFLKANPESSIDFIKMDAEGMEDQILQGAKEFFKAQQPLVMFEIKDSKDVNTHLLKAFDEFGYELFQLVPGLQVLKPFNAQEDIDTFQLNLFAVHPNTQEVLMDRELLVRGDVVDIMKEGMESKLTAEEVSGALGLMPFAKSLVSQWNLEHVSQNGMAEAMGYYIYACMPALEMNLRCAALFKAYGCYQNLHEKEPSMNTAFTCARMALELGEQKRAISFIQDIEKNNLVYKDSDFFLPPVEEMDIYGEGLDFEQMSLETLCHIMSYSSYFIPELVKELLQDMGPEKVMTPVVKKQLSLCR